jgi:hypothetical protein
VTVAGTLNEFVLALVVVVEGAKSVAIWAKAKDGVSSNEAQTTWWNENDINTPLRKNPDNANAIVRNFWSVCLGLDTGIANIRTHLSLILSHSQFENLDFAFKMLLRQ